MSVIVGNMFRKHIKHKSEFLFPSFSYWRTRVVCIKGGSHRHHVLLSRCVQ